MEMEKMERREEGKPVRTIMDEFSANFRTAFDPPLPPAPFLGKM